MNCKYCNADCVHRGEHREKECKGYIPKTNADRIRAMSDEELATDLIDMFQEICEDGVPSKEWVLEWLRQPAEMKENGHGEE